MICIWAVRVYWLGYIGSFAIRVGYIGYTLSWIPYIGYTLYVGYIGYTLLDIRLGYIGSFAILIANIFIIAYFLQFLSQSDEICHHLHQKILFVPFWQICQYLKLCLLPVFYCITIAVLHYLASQRQQCCSLCCINEILS